MKKLSETKLTSRNSFSIEKLLQYCEPIRSTRKLAKIPTKSPKIEVKLRKWPPAPPTSLPPKEKTFKAKKRKFEGEAEETCNNLPKISKKSPPHPTQKKVWDETGKMKMTGKVHLDTSTTVPSKMKLTLQKSKVGNLKEIFENITRVRHSSASRETRQS